MFKSIKSGSTGNLYFLSSGDERLIIECGIPWKQMREYMDFDFSSICGCLVTHSHKDHAGHIDKVINAAIKTYASQETFDAFGVTDYLAHPVSHGKMFQVGPFKVIPFNTEHDCPGSVGFLITDGNFKLMFATDTQIIRPRFNGLTHIAIECNYEDVILEHRFEKGKIHPNVYNRVKATHMSLERCLKFLDRTDLKKVQVIYLIHGSLGNLDPDVAKYEVAALTGKMVIVC